MKRTFAARFSQRTQRQGETAEEFAAELKRLYAKAYNLRGETTRQSDLVWRFLDGLRDSDSRFEVEYNKKPVNIQEVVFHVVNFVQLKRRGQSEESSEALPIMNPKMRVLIGYSDYLQRKIKYKT